MTTCVVKNLYTSKENSYKPLFIFLSLMFSLRPTLRYVTILLIIYFYLIDITYDYNKLLLIDKYYD